MECVRPYFSPGLQYSILDLEGTWRCLDVVRKSWCGREILQKLQNLLLSTPQLVHTSEGFFCPMSYIILLKRPLNPLHTRTRNELRWDLKSGLTPTGQWHNCEWRGAGWGRNILTSRCIDLNPRKTQTSFLHCQLVGVLVIPPLHNDPLPTPRRRANRPPHPRLPTPNPPQPYRRTYYPSPRLWHLEPQRLKQFRCRLPRHPNRLPPHWLRRHLWQWKSRPQRHQGRAWESWAQAEWDMGDVEAVERSVGLANSRRGEVLTD